MQVKEIEILVHNVFKPCVINFYRMKLLVILFIIKIYARNIFKVQEEIHVVMPEISNFNFHAVLQIHGMKPQSISI